MGQASPSRIFFAVMLVACAALAGCGRRGPLELPPGAPTPAAANTTTELADKQAAAFNDAAPAGVLQSPNQVVQVKTTSAQLAALPPSRAINAPPKPKPSTFLLDPLL